jgi:hypothetical protein
MRVYEKKRDVILNDYPDTYNFLLSLQDGLANIGSYA